MPISRHAFPLLDGVILPYSMYNPGMASWIVHLRLAENLLRLIPGLDAASFAVGSIAPDSGIPDAKWEQFDPPTQVTHFGAFPHLADLEFYRRYLLPLRGGQEQAQVPFRLGYFFHLVTDNLWSEQIGIPTHQRHAAAFAANKDFIWEVKKDWYGLDHIYVRDHPDCLFWRVFLDGIPTTGGLDFLPLEAVRQRVAYIQEYYQRIDAEVEAAYHRQYSYLSAAEMDRFVGETTLQLFRIYQYLWVNATNDCDQASALDLKK